MVSRKTADETTGERVLRVATELFAKRGFDATGVQELSDATGLGRGALYYHIKSKNDLLSRIAVGLLERAVDAGRSIVDSGGTVEDRLVDLSDSLLQDLSCNRDAWITSMRDWEALDDPSRERVLALRDEYESVWQRLFDEGAEQGVLRPVDPVLRRAIIGMYTSSYRWIEASGPMSPQQISRIFLQFILDGTRREK